MMTTLTKTERKGVYQTVSEDDRQSSISDINRFLASVEQRAFITARIATSDDDEALEIVQDAMMKMAQKYQNIIASEWPPYFFRILYNKINDWHRRQSVRNRWRTFFDSSATDSYQPEGFVEQILHRNPDEMLSDEETSHRLLEVVEGLSLRQKQALMLRLWEGFSVAETASIMRCSEGSVKTHFSRAMNKLKQELKELT